jgi:hypothetical protein
MVLETVPLFRVEGKGGKRIFREKAKKQGELI